jgi:prophage regulatory protein
MGSTAAADRHETHLDRFLRLREVELFAGLKRTQINDLIKAGAFPAPVRLSDGGRAVAWLASELATWQAARIAKRDTTPRRDVMADVRAKRRPRRRARS